MSTKKKTASDLQENNGYQQFFTWGVIAIEFINLLALWVYNILLNFFDNHLLLWLLGFFVLFNLLIVITKNALYAMYNIMFNLILLYLIGLILPTLFFAIETPYAAIGLLIGCYGLVIRQAMRIDIGKYRKVFFKKQCYLEQGMLTLTCGKFATMDKALRTYYSKDRCKRRISIAYDTCCWILFFISLGFAYVQLGTPIERHAIEPFLVSILLVLLGIVFTSGFIGAIYMTFFLYQGTRGVHKKFAFYE